MIFGPRIPTMMRRTMPQFAKRGERQMATTTMSPLSMRTDGLLAAVTVSALMYLIYPKIFLQYF